MRELGQSRQLVYQGTGYLIRGNTGIYHVKLRRLNRKNLFHEESDYPPSDLEVTEMLLEECHGMPIERISSLPKQDRNKILISVLKKGAGIRQLSEISVVGFSIIRRLKNVSDSPFP